MSPALEGRPSKERIMKGFAAIAFVTLAAGATAVAQDQASIDRALAAAPRQAREGAAVIKWKPDFTYDTLKEGTNRIVCYDQSGQPGEQPFSVQCTSVGNLPRVAQNRKFEMEQDRKVRQVALDAAEKDGSRVKPEYGSVWYSMSGKDQSSARLHVTVAVPGATTATTGLPEDNKQGGAWLMNAGTSTAHIMVPGS
ncbi:MAG: hypothetical protein R2712_31690 [Vicinamibacterales bacterium]